MATMSIYLIESKGILQERILNEKIDIQLSLEASEMSHAVQYGVEALGIARQGCCRSQSISLLSQPRGLVAPEHRKKKLKPHLEELCTTTRTRTTIVNMSAIGSLVFCTDCGNLLDSSTGNQNTILLCDCCSAENQGMQYTISMHS